MRVERSRYPRPPFRWQIRRFARTGSRSVETGDPQGEVPWLVDVLVEVYSNSSIDMEMEIATNQDGRQGGHVGDSSVEHTSRLWKCLQAR